MPALADMPVVLDTRVVAGAGGGPDKTILNSPRFLRPLGYDMRCAYMHRPGDAGFAQLVAKAQALQAPLLAVVDRGPLDWRIFTQMLAICRRERVAIWHGHDYKSNLLGLLLRPFWKMHLVTTAHGWVEHTRRTPLYYAIDRWCLPRYERVICVSQDLYHAARACGVAKRRCHLIENAIDTANYQRNLSIAEAKTQLGIAPQRLLVGGVGRLSAEKGFDLLIRAVDRLLRAGLDLELVIVGEGNEKERLQALIAELGRTERIRLLGFRSDPRDFYQALDVYALSSLREGLPNVLLEAMALAVPVVATAIAGVPNLVAHEQSGLVIPPASVDALTEALARLLAAADLRERYGRAGRQTIEERYCFAMRMQKIASLYDELLHKKTSAGD